MKVGTALCAMVGAVTAGAAYAQPTPSMTEWTGLGGDEARTGARGVAAGSLAAPRWVVHETDAGEELRFVGPAGLVGTLLPMPRLFATAVVGEQTAAVAIDAEEGRVVWVTPLPDLIYDSWSTPALDVATGTVVYATGASVTAVQMATGRVVWQTAIGGPPVNVSPVVTRDLAPCNRVFVTDYGGFGGASYLYCINASPWHPTVNPFRPGEIVWSVSIGSSTGGTPAYLDGVVYVASSGLDLAGYGEIRAFEARSTGQPKPTWVFTNPIREGFFGGVTIRDQGVDGGMHVYGATYAFYGQLDSANLVKVDARTGELAWSVPSNRTDSIPIVLPDNRVVLSTGIQGFGSVPMVQMFEDHGGSASLAWSTATSTWRDKNKDGVMQVGEFLLVGGWTTQPVACGVATSRLLVGAIPTGEDFFGAYAPLYELDLSKSPASAGFVVQQSELGGSTPAMLGSGVYSVGPHGLAAFGPPPSRPDVNRDGLIDINDVYAWQRGIGFRDVDRSGAVDVADRDWMLHELSRRTERDSRGATPGGR